MEFKEIECRFDTVFKHTYEEGFADGKNSAYETIVVAQDCTNVSQVYNIFGATNNPDDKIVLFINKEWAGVPEANMPNNKGLFMLWLSKEFSITNGSASMSTFWGRLRDGTYGANMVVNSQYDYIVSAGEEWTRVVLL